MEPLKALLSNAQVRFAQLSPRERRLVTVAGAMFTALVLFITLFSFSSTAASHRRRTEDKLRKLAEVEALAASFREAEQNRQAVERQLTSNDVRLISYLEEKGTAAGLDISTMNPRADTAVGDGKIIESAVEVFLTDVSLRRLTEFLSSVESGPGVVRVKTIQLEPRPESEAITARVTIATYKMKP